TAQHYPGRRKAYESSRRQADPEEEPTGDEHGGKRDRRDNGLAPRRVRFRVKFPGGVAPRNIPDEHPYSTEDHGAEGNARDERCLERQIRYIRPAKECGAGGGHKAAADSVTTNPARADHRESLLVHLPDEVSSSPTSRRMPAPPPSRFA